jgi:DNA polymerase-3 subunit gamma/tau
MTEDRPAAAAQAAVSAAVAQKQEPVEKSAPESRKPASQPQAEPPKADQPKAEPPKAAEELPPKVSESTSAPQGSAPRAMEPGNTDDWASLVARLPLAGITRQFALQCSLVNRAGDLFELSIEPSQVHFRNEKREESLRHMLEETLGRPVRLNVTVAGGGVSPAMVQQRQESERQQQAESAITDDPNVQTLIDRFGGRIAPGSVRPLDE